METICACFSISNLGLSKLSSISLPLMFEAPTLFRFNVSCKAPCDFDNFEVSNGPAIQLFLSLGVHVLRTSVLGSRDLIPGTHEFTKFERGRARAMKLAPPEAE